MEVRRLVKSGAASHTISLPKTWITKNKLNRGDMLYIVENAQNQLMISVSQTQETAQAREISIQIDGKDLDTINREITSAYINNYNTITILGKELTHKVKDIRKMLHDFVALEINEQTGTRIVAHDLLNPKEISIEKTTRRMDMMIRSIIEDSRTSISQTDMYESVYYRDFDVNKLYFLMLRLLKSALRDPKVATGFGIDQATILNYWNLVANLENLGDIAKNICKNTRVIKDQAVSAQISDVFKELESQYLDAIKAYYTQNKALADSVSSRRKTVLEHTNNVLEKYTDAAVAIIMTDFKGMEDTICNIARLVIDDDREKV